MNDIDLRELNHLEIRSMNRKNWRKMRLDMKK